MTAQEHNRLVGIFLMAHGGLQALVFGLIGLIYGGIGTAIFFGERQPEAKMVGGVFIVMIFVLAVMGAIFVLPQILGGLKIFKEKQNARIWGIVGSIISCLFFPLGTAAGVYGLWFLFGEQGSQFYSHSGPSSAPQYVQPPPPNSWR